MNIAELRKEKGLTQKEAASLIGVPYRTFVRYEKDPAYADSFKYRSIYRELSDALMIDEEHGILSLEQIRSIVVPILKRVGIERCYLFGSYARGCPKPNSDVDLLVDTEITGMSFFMLIDEIRESLHKKVDLLRLVDLTGDNPILIDILKEGVRLL